MQRCGVCGGVDGDGFDVELSYLMRERNLSTLEDMEKNLVGVEDNLLNKKGIKILMNENRRTEDKKMIQQNEEVHFGESQQRDIHEADEGKK